MRNCNLGIKLYLNSIASNIYLWIIKESEWRIICAKEVSDHFIVNLYSREFQHKSSVTTLKIFIGSCKSKCQITLNAYKLINPISRRYEMLEQYLVYIVKYILHSILSNTRHGICLSAACLSIRENTCWTTISMGD